MKERRKIKYIFATILLLSLITLWLSNTTFFISNHIMVNDTTMIDNKTVEKEFTYYSAGSFIIRGSGIGTYTRTLVKDSISHIIQEQNYGSGYQFEIMYGFNIGSFNDILRYELKIYLQNNLSETCNIMLYDNTNSKKEIIGTDNIASYHWKNITFTPTNPEDYIDKLSENMIRLFINDSIISGDSVSNDISFDYIVLVVVIDIHDITKPNFSSYPINQSFEKDYSSGKISWLIEENFPNKYIIYRNTINIQNATYTNLTPILCNIDTSVVGLWNYTIFADDMYGNNNTNTIFITIDPKINPSIIQKPSNREIERGTGFFLIWKISEKYPDKYILYVNDSFYKSGSYLNNQEISIEINTSVIGLYTFLIVFNDTSNNLLQDTVTISVVEEYTEPPDLTLLWIIIIGISIVGAISTMILYSRIRKKKEYKNYKIQTEKEKIYKDFIDLTNINKVLLLSMDSGLVLSNISVRQLRTDKEEELIGGFLHAVAGLGDELTGGKLKTIEYEGFKTLVTSGQYMRLAIFLKEKPSDRFEDKVKKFLKIYEVKKQNITFAGNLKVYDDFPNNFINFFGMKIVKQYELINTVEKIVITTQQKKILDICKKIGLDFDNKNLREIIEICSKDLKIPEYQLYEDVINLTKINILIPTEI